MTKQEAFRLIGEIDGRYVEAAQDCAPRKRINRKRNMRMLAAAAACLVLAAGIFAGAMRYHEAARQIPLVASSAGVTARYTDKAFDPVSAGGENSLVWLSEDEIFTHWNTAIFRGTVTDVRNVEIDFAGRKMYRAIAWVRVCTVVRGPYAEGEEVKILLPGAAASGSRAEDCGVIESIRVGIEGIFMPIVYDDENNFLEMNGVTLDKRDLAPCGLADGERWAFFETPHRLIYAESAFPSLAGAKTLDEVEAFLREKAG